MGRVSLDVWHLINMPLRLVSRWGLTPTKSGFYYKKMHPCLLANTSYPCTHQAIFLELRGQKSGCQFGWLPETSKGGSFTFGWRLSAGNLELQLTENSTDRNVRRSGLQLLRTIFRKYLGLKMGWCFEGPGFFKCCLWQAGPCKPKEAPQVEVETHLRATTNLPSHLQVFNRRCIE